MRAYVTAALVTLSAASCAQDGAPPVDAEPFGAPEQGASAEAGADDVVRPSDAPSAQDAKDAPSGVDAGLKDAGAKDSSGFETGTACPLPGQMFCAGQCIDVQSNPQNCGACGHGCLGQACSEGACVPTTLSTAYVAWGDLAQDSSTLYFTNADGALRAVPKIGGVTRTIAAGLGSPLGVAVDANYAYVADAGKNKILKITLSDGTLTDLVANLSTPQAVTIDAANVYFTTYGSGAVNGSVLGCAKTGCNNAPAKYFGLLQLYPAGISGPMASLVADAAYLYYGSAFVNGEVHRAPIGGGPDELVFSNFGPPGALAFANNTLAILTWGPGAQARVATPGSQTSTVLASGLNHPLGLAMTDTDLYWTMYEPGWADGGQVFKCPLTGCVETGPQLLAKGTQPSSAIVADATSVYWLSNDGNVYRTPR